MLGIRQKLSLGFGGMLAIIVVIGLQSITQLTVLGHSIDVILRENYRSVIASQQMKEALERVDSGTLFALLGESRRGSELIEKNVQVFNDALQAELDNITLPGEAEKATHLQRLFSEYRETLGKVLHPDTGREVRREEYFERLLPLFQEIKDTADQILQLNQRSMIDANARARSMAAAAQHRMYLLLLLGAGVALVFVFFTGKWVLRPITSLIRSADEISRGNLDLVVQRGSRDEIGRLSEAFNEMASSLRQFRRTNRSRLARMERSTQQVFKSLPDAVAVVDLDGRVEVSTDTAGEVFGLRPEVRIRSLDPDRMGELFDEALRSGRTVEPLTPKRTVQRFVKGEEHYFDPLAVPILDAEKRPTGVILILKDVTQQRHQDELKRGVISTVSHQLKTPLTSLRMAVYLLLEEKVGPLTPKQVELLMAAREDSDRLHSILGDLLDISRIESGKAQLAFAALSPHDLVLEQVELFRSTAQDRGVTLDMDMQADLPEVWADPARIGHVLINLLSNALKYTSPGGRVAVTAESREEAVLISVSDTGKGVPPEYLDRLFDQFFRVPGQDGQAGEGLGLTIARDIVEAHGGAIHVESGEGKGSVFTFSLKRADRVRSGGQAGEKTEP